ncbi:MAG: Mur ligase domain-containing protein [Candidatus Syntrophopropionicum ammoniitolerans]
MFLQDVIDVVDVRDYAGDPATPIEGIAYDSRQVKPGFLFVAIEGFNTDGHSYINEAIRRGSRGGSDPAYNQCPGGHSLGSD